MIGKEELDRALLEAAKSIIRMNTIREFDVFKQNFSATGDTEETLESDRMEAGYLYVVNHISAYEEGTQVTASLTLGYETAGFFHVLIKERPDEDMTTDWDGQIILHEGDTIKAKFTNTTATDKLYLYATGYRIPLR